VEKAVLSFFASSSCSELVVVDDGSSKVHHEMLTWLQKRYGMTVIYKRENTGIAKTKNSCLKIFLNSSFDHLFLVDHDMYFLKPGWDRHYIDTAKGTGFKHLSLYTACNEHPCNRTSSNGTDCVLTPGLQGAFLYVDRGAVASVGGFRIFPRKYGMEHVDWSHRLKAHTKMQHNVDAPNSLSYVTIQSALLFFRILRRGQWQTKTSSTP